MSTSVQVLFNGSRSSYATDFENSERAGPAESKKAHVPRIQAICHCAFKERLCVTEYIAEASSCVHQMRWP